MGQESKFRVVLLDIGGYVLAERPAENLKEARTQMKHLLSEEYARGAETSHEKMRTEKAEVRNADGECVLDAFIG